jgi:uncharacterized protein (TIGR00725 family)
MTSTKTPLIIGVMGGGESDPENAEAAYRLGSLIAKQGWILLNGGRNSGIMDASARGASAHGGLTVGILPDDNRRRVSDYISIPIVTGLGNARNCINVLSSDFVVACPGGAGTLSEIALALKIGKPVILLNYKMKDMFDGFIKIAGSLYRADTPEEAVDWIIRHRSRSSPRRASGPRGS